MFISVNLKKDLFAYGEMHVIVLAAWRLCAKFSLQVCDWMLEYTEPFILIEKS